MPQSPKESLPSDLPAIEPASPASRDRLGLVGGTVFALLVGGAVLAFPAVRDLSLFRDIFLAICAPFV